MPIPEIIKIKNKNLPEKPGVYLMRNKNKKIIYIGKATSLKSRVSSYFNRTNDPKTAKLVENIKSIDYKETDSVLEALILESRLIKEYKPKYNIKDKDDRSFIHLAITKDEYPKLFLIREIELKNKYKESNFTKIFGPFASRKILEAVLEIVRRIFPFSNCAPNQGMPCFNRQLGRCPGVCTGEISARDYRRTINNISLLFLGKKKELLKKMEAEMKKAAREEKFEEAARLRNQINKLKHIQDVALLQKDEAIPSGRFGRVEAYDISNISGTAAVGSMVVFSGGLADKSQYRKFAVRSIHQIDDTGMMREVLARRFNNSWPYPDIILVDGGRGQVNAALFVLRGLKLDIPVIGLAKGPERKKNELIFGFSSEKLKREVRKNINIFIRARDEAHRFAINYHRKKRIMNNPAASGRGKLSNLIIS